MPGSAAKGDGESMKVGVNSDFRDYYDHWFDPSPWNCIVQRQTKQGLNKRDQFALLEQIGFAVPLHGIAKDIVGKSNNDRLVVYEDESLHCGEGKLLCSTQAASTLHDDKYASIFIPTTEHPEDHAVSRRLLGIGDRLFWLRYESFGSWQSNHAHNVRVVVQSETLSRDAYAAEGELNFSLLKPYPLFAIDFVESLQHQTLMAIDFNSAPGLKGTGMEDVISAQDVVRAIRSFLVEAGIAHPQN